MLWFLLGVMLFVPVSTWAARGTGQKLSELTVQFEEVLDQLYLQVLDPQTGEAIALEETTRKLDELVPRLRQAMTSSRASLSEIISDNDLQELALNRYDEMAADFERDLARLEAAISSQNPNQLRKLLSQLRRTQHKSLTGLPVQALQLTPIKTINPELEPLPESPQPQDMVSLSEGFNLLDIIPQGDKLAGNPKAISRWVAQNIRYLPLFGATKSAVRCLQDRSGTDFDRAALVLALLRESEIPARYVYGNMRLTPEELASQLGVSSSPAAEKLILSGGIPYQDGLLGRVWVRAYLDNNWVDVDPGFTIYNQELAESGITPFSPDEEQFFSRLFGINPPQWEMGSKEEIEDQSPKRIANKASAASPTKNIIWEADQLPPEYSYRVSLSLKREERAEEIGLAEFSLLEAGAEPLYLLSLPVSSKEVKLLEALGKSNESPLPGYLFRMKTVIMLGDTAIVHSEPVALGAKLNLHLEFLGPTLGLPAVDHTIYGGTQAAVGLAVGYSSGAPSVEFKKETGWNIAGKLRAYLLSLIRDNLQLGPLADVTLAYQKKQGDNSKALASATGVYAIPMLGESMAAQSAAIEYLFNQPISFDLSGVEMDVGAQCFNLASVSSQDRDNNRSNRRFLLWQGLYGSIQEQRQLESLAGAEEGISAAKALLLAKAEGQGLQDMEIKHLSPDKSSLSSSEFNLTPDIKQDIQKAFSAGWEVIIPSGRTTADGEWQGKGYVIYNPLTGAGAYLLHNGLAGTATQLGGTMRSNVNIGGSLPHGWLGKLLIILLILGVMVLLVAI